MNDTQKMGDAFGARVKRAPGLASDFGIQGRWAITCRDKNGDVKWSDIIENLVTNAGLDYLLDAGLSGGSQITSWYVGLTDGTPTAAAGDTMSSHGGWTEVTAYDESTREAWTDGGVSGQSVSNSGNAAQFTISTNGTTIGGAFLASDSTKGGSSGTLYAIGAFSAGDKSLDDGDTLDITAAFTASAS